MEPLQNSVSQLDTPRLKNSLFTPLLTVTIVSKYVALILFIVMPFIGGYIGYRLGEVNESSPALVSSQNPNMMNPDLPKVELASTSVFEVVPYECAADMRVALPHTCFKVINTQTGLIIIENLTTLALEQNILNTNLTDTVVLVKVVYVSSDKNTVYFYSGIPGSDACCNLHALRLDTLTFFDVSSLQGSFSQSIVSPNKRYIAWVNSTGMYLSVSDLERQIVMVTLPVSKDYTLLGRCNDFAGVEIGDITFKSGTLVSYGLFDARNKNDCQTNAVEYRNLSF